MRSGGWEFAQRLMVKSPKKLYSFHVANLRAVSSGFDHVLTSARSAIARDDDDSTKTYICLLSFLLGTWSEVRLLKMLYEPMGFSQNDRNRVLKASALDSWVLSVEIAFRKHYCIPRAALCPPKLPSTAHFRFKRLNRILKHDLGALITMRNKLAHGQWEYPLNKALNDVAQSQRNSLRIETVLSLIQKRKLLEILCQVINDLTVSRPTFERDWDKHFRQFEQTRTNLKRKSYSKWESQIIRRFKRGRTRRAAIN